MIEAKRGTGGWISFAEGITARTSMFNSPLSGPGTHPAGGGGGGRLGEAGHLGTLHTQQS